MITSRHNTFGCWFISILTFLFLSFLSGEILNHYSIFKINYFIKLDNKSFYFLITLVGCIGFLFLTLISAYIKKIEINPIDKKIIFKNIVTRQSKKYDFDYFDGIADTYLNHDSGSYKTVGLVKDKKIIRYIDSFWVSNYDDLRHALQDLTCFGTYNLGAWKKFKLLLKLPVID